MLHVIFNQIETLYTFRNVYLSMSVRHREKQPELHIFAGSGSQYTVYPIARSRCSREELYDLHYSGSFLHARDTVCAQRAMILPRVSRQRISLLSQLGRNRAHDFHRRTI